MKQNHPKHNHNQYAAHYPKHKHNRYAAQNHIALSWQSPSGPLKLSHIECVRSKLYTHRLHHVSNQEKWLGFTIYTSTKLIRWPNVSWI